MRYLTLLAFLALGACKAEETRGENDSIKASTNVGADSGAATAGVDTNKAGATKQP